MHRTHARRAYKVLRKPVFGMARTSPAKSLRQRIDSIPAPIVRPPFVSRPEVLQRPRQLTLKTRDECERQRRTCQAARDTLRYAESLLEPGRTTSWLDEQLHQYMVHTQNAYPSPLGYHGFPRSVCTSVNNVVCHGIPDDRPLQAGDLISVDVTLYREGMHGDTCATFLVPGQSEGEDHLRALRLSRATKEAMMAGISCIRPGIRVREIGKHIQTVADRYGYASVRELCGHGIGKDFHERPHVEHFDVDVLLKGKELEGEEAQEGESDPDRELMLEPGMVFTVEPMLCEGSAELEQWDDGWTIVTRDGSLCAQFEHTVAVTETGVEIWTL